MIKVEFLIFIFLVLISISLYFFSCHFLNNKENFVTTGKLGYSGKGTNNCFGCNEYENRNENGFRLNNEFKQSNHRVEFEDNHRYAAKKANCGCLPQMSPFVNHSIVNYNSSCSHPIRKNGTALCSTKLNNLRYKNHNPEYDYDVSNDTWECLKECDSRTKTLVDKDSCIVSCMNYDPHQVCFG